MSILATVPGYDTSVLYNKCPLSSAKFGFLNYRNEGVFTISLELKAAMASTYAFSVTPVYRVNPSNKSIISINGDDDKFTFDVPIRCNGRGKWGYTSDSTVRFIAYNDRREMCEYEVGVYTQRGKHFLGMQRNWQDRLCINAEGKPVMENVQWEQLATYLTSTLNIRPQGMLGDLPKKELVLPTPTKDLGVVRWFKFTGIGAIETLEGMAKVHYSDIISRDRNRPAILQPNQQVKAKLISAEEAAKNSKHRINFPWIAKEVQPII